MSSWDVNYWPWGGVTICLNEQETKIVLNASDVGTALGGLIAVAPSPVQIAGAVIAAYISAEKAVAENVDQGNGVCFFLPWAAISLGQWWVVIPSPAPAPPQSLNQQHVNYIGTDGHVHELWYSDSGGWQWNDLTALAKTTMMAASGSALDGYATTYNNQQHVNYLGTDGHVHELVWNSNSGSWQDNDLSGLAQSKTSKPIPQPASGSPLDGYQTTFNNQQHVN
jgi:hypothetical protein